MDSLNCLNVSGTASQETLRRDKANEALSFAVSSALAKLAATTAASPVSPSISATARVVPDGTGKEVENLIAGVGDLLHLLVPRVGFAHLSGLMSRRLTPESTSNWKGHSRTTRPVRQAHPAIGEDAAQPHTRERVPR
ncbi:hypothetical protein HET69_29680 [Streptomyces sp. CJ_13]|uniref:hypothetical protein n=1 Tax=Streptomyces TaxID=1883 RepID=UPI001BDBCC99|nr:hypothetical protein [Streptomyces sp. CJ_13]MBT1188035.1 hypothetical protein [Streptomyces sp. CJ_13]WSY02091.1 hypothetical protein OG590_35570 [Streptomyces goshikiensis]